MPVKVLVDADDLETLLFATGVVKALERALHAATEDEQWRMAQPKITAAHSRLADEWRGALRQTRYFDPPQAPSDHELAMIRALVKLGAAQELGIEVAEPHLYRTMVAKGWAKIGVHQHRVIWGDNQEATTTQSSKARLKLTDAAIEAIGGLDATIDEEPPPRKGFWARLLGS